MLFVWFVSFVVAALAIANLTSQWGCRRISWFLIFATTVVGAGTGAATPRSLEVRIKASISDEPRPMVRGTTNLPDGTNLEVWVRKAWLPDGSLRLAAGLAACGDDCLPLTAPGPSLNVLSVNATVANGQFEAGPFTDPPSKNTPPYHDARDPPRGRYILEVSAWSARQPVNVREVIGQRGENLAGSLIERCCLGPPESVLAGARKNLRILSSENGALIYYGRYVEIAPRDSGKENLSPPKSAVAESLKCSGILYQTSESLMFGGGRGETEGICLVNGRDAYKVLQICRIGKPCTVEGSGDLCKNSGECVEITNITTVRRARD